MPRMSERPASAEHPGAGSFDPADHPPIAFADDDWAYICERVQALGLPDQTAHRARYEAIYGHLVGVNSWTNLTRITSTREFLVRHILDSLTLLNIPEVTNVESSLACLDLGSGGGYPGLPLCIHQPEQWWVLLDSRKKKVDFMNAAIPLTGSTVGEARHFRAREVAVFAPDLHESCQLVVSRAAGPAQRIIEEAAPLLMSEGHLVLAKGPGFVGDESAEANKARKQFGFKAAREEYVQLEAGDPERLILIYEKK